MAWIGMLTRFPPAIQGEEEVSRLDSQDKRIGKDKVTMRHLR